LRKRSPMVVLLAFAVHLCVSYAQAQIGDFRGLPWGASKDDVIKVEGNKTLDRSTTPLWAAPSALVLGSPGLDSLVYAGKAGDLDCVYAFYFAGDKLVQGRCVFSEKHTDANLYIDDFQAVNTLLTEEYGKPEEDGMMWSDDRYKGDRANWGKAVAEGHLAYHALRRLPDTAVMHQMRGINNEPLHAIQYESMIKEHLDLVREAREKAKAKIR